MGLSSVKTLKYTLFFIFFLSGFSGLIYESIWTHYIKLLLGHAAYAQTLVLSIFMGGMAIGAALTARKNKPIKSPLKAYAIVEAIVGALAIVFHSVFIYTEALIHETFLPSIESAMLVEITRWSIAALLILPQSVLLGTTFPLIGTAIVRLDQQRSGSTLGMLYFTNSIGAALGVLASAFVLIGALGLPGTILTAGIINILIAIFVWGLSKGEATQPVAPPTQENTSANVTSEQKSTVQWLLGVALLTGLASFFYEIAWIRMLSLILGSSMQAFELMLSAFITGIALGGLWIRKRSEKTKNPALFLGKVQIIMGLLALATLPLYGQMFELMSFLMQSLTKSEQGYLFFNLGSHLVAILIMLPATFMAGMTLPLITFILIKWNHGESSIGRVYAFNTIGAIIGILVSVHLLMTTIGTKGIIIAGSLIDICLGLYLVFRFINKQQKTRKLWVTSAVTLTLFLTFSISTQFDPFMLSSGVYRTGTTSRASDSELLYYQDGKTASISVFESATGAKSISTNGKPDASINPPEKQYSPDEITMVMAATLSLAVHPEAKKIANIGLGSGLTTHTLLLSEKLASVDTIEIESAVVEGIENFGATTGKALTDPRSNIIIDDAKSYFSRNKTQYDVIISEPSNPWVSGVAGLFSAEFYHHINRYLKQDGIFVQWLHLYETNTSLVASVFNALGDNFENYAVYNTIDQDIIIIASNQRDETQLDNQLFVPPQLNKQLQRVNINTVDDMTARLLITKEIIQPFFNASNVPANSDYFPFLALNAPKSRFLRQSATTLAELNTSHFPPIQLIKPIIENQSEGLYFNADNAKRKAKRIIQFLTDSKLNGNDQKLSESIKSQVMIIKENLKSCNAYSTWQHLFDSSLLSIATNTLAFIDNKETQRFWKNLSEHPCMTSWPNLTQQRINLYTSIALKDFSSTSRFSNLLLQAGGNKIYEETSYLIGAALFSYLKTGQFEQGLQFFLNLQKKFGNQLVLPFYQKIFIILLEKNSVNAKINTQKEKN